MGIHESQSLFFENFIGRNKSFWKKNYDLLKEYSNGQFDDMSVDEFYNAINESKPSFIRIEADELTYPLHVMVRYELEKELFDGTLQVKDLPAAWNDKMEAYLEFVRKMMHKVYCKMFTGLVAHLDTSILCAWLHVCSAFKQRMLKDIPNFDALLEEGNVTPIREWLTEHIHQYGKTKSRLKF